MTERTRTATPTITAMQTPASPDLVVTDGGLETWLLFQRGIDLPAFAAYPLASTSDGRALLREYFDHYLAIARASGAALQLEAPTWRANPDWAAVLGHGREQLAGMIRAAVAVVTELRAEWREEQRFVAGGAVGPRGDGYRAAARMDAREAQSYHAFQIEQMAAAGIDVVTAMTIGYPEEAIGIVRAAAAADVPVVVSFTVETDGRLPSSIPLGEAITATDEATGGYASTFMINCAHPTHFAGALEHSAPWTRRIGAVRANASLLSHAELDEMEHLDDGDPGELAARYLELRELLPELRMVGGCCGTDHRHVGAIVEAWTRAGGG